MSRGEKEKKSSLPIVLVLGAGCLVLGLPCIGIAAAVAIPAFVRYTKQAKTSEAKMNVRMLATGMQSHCTNVGSLPGPAGPLPLTIPGTAKVVETGWSTQPGFDQAGFYVSDPIYYSYSIQPGIAGAMEAVAEGDLDGDGVASRFAITCYDTCVCDPIMITHELE